MITFSLLAMMIIVPSVIPSVGGVYIVSSKWGTHGTADGQFNLPGPHCCRQFWKCIRI